MKWSNPKQRKIVVVKTAEDEHDEYNERFERSISRKSVEEHLDNRESILGNW